MFLVIQDILGWSACGGKMVIRPEVTVCAWFKGMVPRVLLNTVLLLFDFLLLIWGKRVRPCPESLLGLAILIEVHVLEWSGFKRQVACPREPEGRLGNQAGGGCAGTVEVVSSLQSVLCVARLRKYIGFGSSWFSFCRNGPGERLLYGATYLDGPYF